MWAQCRARFRVQGSSLFVHLFKPCTSHSAFFVCKNVSLSCTYDDVRFDKHGFSIVRSAAAAGCPGLEEAVVIPCILDTPHLQARKVFSIAWGFFEGVISECPPKDHPIVSASNHFLRYKCFQSFSLSKCLIKSLVRHSLNQELKWKWFCVCMVQIHSVLLKWWGQGSVKTTNSMQRWPWHSLAACVWNWKPHNANPALGSN